MARPLGVSDTEGMSMKMTDRLRSAAWGPPFFVCAGWAALSVALVWGVTGMEQSRNPPSCYGIGWGCTPDPGGAALLFGVFIVFPGLILGCSAIAALGFFGVSRRARMMAVNWAAGALMVALLMVLLSG